MLKLITISVLLMFGGGLLAQQGAYTDSLRAFRNDYIRNHEIVKDSSRLAFFPVDEHYRVICRFEKADNAKWFRMSTSSGEPSVQRRYGYLFFTLGDTSLRLTVYQSQRLMSSAEYHDYLLVPFTDATSGEATYGGGRYIDVTTGDIQNGRCVLDFNKAYNPYCAYAEGYSCPIPPKENHLPVFIAAGEKLMPVKRH